MAMTAKRKAKGKGMLVDPGGECLAVQAVSMGKLLLAVGVDVAVDVVDDDDDDAEWTGSDGLIEGLGTFCWRLRLDFAHLRRSWGRWSSLSRNAEATNDRRRPGTLHGLRTRTGTDRMGDGPRMTMRVDRTIAL